MDEVLESQMSAEIQRLLTEHQRYSLRLESLMTKPYLSSDEQLEEVRLKKMKLHAKDLISAIEQLLRLSGGLHGQGRPIG
jgi:hypothetical protein